VVTIQGVDNNAIALHICRAKKQFMSSQKPPPSPCILHIHGGGMSILSTTDPVYRVTRLRLAELGFTVIGVEFRNAAGKLGPHPFPAGLNDCMSSLEYIYANKKRFNIDKIVLLGDSGGANLSMAVSLLARQRHSQRMIDGIYAMCPFIYGNYDYQSNEMDTYPDSLRENDGLLLPRGQEMKSMSMLYLPPDENPTDHPLAWPYHASLTQLEGLPPHVISVNELDPCRDEGLEYCQKLVEAGVSARSRVVLGTCHAGELLFMKFLPDIFAATLKDVKDFVKTL
jgi:acetyl esterase